MEHLIQLKSGVETLSTDEFIELVQSFGKDYFTTILFDHFNHYFTNSQSQREFNNTISNIRAFNKEISNIVSSRTPNAIMNAQEQELGLKLKPIQIDEIPSVIISQISSYLLFDDLKSFEMCNRSIFTGTRSPISLYELPPEYSTLLINYIRNNEYNNSYFYWYRFRKIKQFELQIDDHLLVTPGDGEDQIEYIYSLNHIPFWNNLESLTISDYGEETEWQWHYDKIDMDRFVSDLTTLNLQNLKQLYHDEWNISNQHMQSLLSNVSNLQFIYFHKESMCGIMPTLTGIRGVGNMDFDLYDHNLEMIPSNIQSLHLCDYDEFSNKGIKFTNLKELCTQFAEKDQIDFFNSQTLTDLQRIHISTPFDQSMNNEYIRSIETLLLKMHSVNYISIDIKGDMMEIMKSLNNALKTLTMSKKSIKIRIDCTFKAAIFYDVNEKIMVLTKILEKNTNDFMIIGSFYVKDANEMNYNSLKCQNNVSIKSAVNIKKDGDVLKSEAKNVLKFVITNKQCKINGYKEKWLMECRCCEQKCYDKL
eukprot:271979_1